MMYYLARNWGASAAGGVLAALLLAFDMLAQIEGRLVLVREGSVGACACAC